jgi:hypothetical protein
MREAEKAIGGPCQEDNTDIDKLYDEYYGDTNAISGNLMTFQSAGECSWNTGFPFNLPIPRTTDGCSSLGVVVPLLYKETPAQHNCCVGHDYCYQRGGTSKNRKVCDMNFFQCLANSTDINWLTCPNYLWQIVGVRLFIRNGVLPARAFNYHKREWTCYFYTKPAGKDVDRYYNLGKLTKFCSACEGKDDCNEWCEFTVEGIFDSNLEYPGIIEIRGTNLIIKFPCVKTETLRRQRE